MSPQNIEEALVQFAHSLLVLGHSASAVEVPRETFIDFVAYAQAHGFKKPTHPKVALLPRRVGSRFGLSWNQVADPKTSVVAVDREMATNGIVFHTAMGGLAVRMSMKDAAEMIEAFSL